MSKTAITVENLSKKYRLGKSVSSLKESISQIWTKASPKKSFWALKDINFELGKGEVLGVIGKNGAGKSTLLKILSRITPPTTGRISMDGKVNSLLEVGTGFHADLTGRENIFLNGVLLGMRKQEVKQKLEEIVDFAGIQAFMDTPVKKYSSGMYVRLAFAVAAHLDTEILIVDEVLAVGDAEFQKKCLHKIDEIQEAGKTVLLVSHNLALINQVCSKALLIHEGKIQAEDSPRNISKLFLEKFLAQKQAPKASIDLLQHPNKQQTEKIGMKNVKIYCDGVLDYHIYSGCHFAFEVEVAYHQNFSNLIFGFVLKNANEQAILGVHNRQLGIQLTPSKGNQTTIRVEIPELLLYGEGNYFVDLYLGDSHFEENFDIIENAFTLQLSQTNVYQSHKLLDPSMNAYYQPDLKIVCS